MFCAINLQNIVLIRDPEDPKKFYPRFNLEDTSSFQNLDDHRYLNYLCVCVDNPLRSLPTIMLLFHHILTLKTVLYLVQKFFSHSDFDFLEISSYKILLLIM